MSWGCSVRPLSHGLPMERKMFGFQVLKAVVGAGALAVIVMSAGVAQAATCTTLGVTVSTACAGPVPGNDKDVYGGGGTTNVNDIDNDLSDGMDEGLFGTNTWTETAKINSPGLLDGILSMTYDNGNTSGTWSVSSWAGIGSAMLVVKAGNEFIAYLLDLTAGTSGIWTTQGLVNNNNELRKISHLTLYTTPAIPPVPVPAAGLLLIGALGGLAALRRRRHV